MAGACISREQKQEEPGCSKGKGVPPMEAALAIDLILEAVFQRLSGKDLLKCALVNSRWRDISRTLYLKQPIRMVKIRGGDLCAFMEHLNNDLGSPSFNFLCNGIALYPCRRENTRDDYVSWYRSNLNRLEFKYMRLDSLSSNRHYLCDESHTCGLPYVKDLLRENLEHLEVLEILGEYESLRQFLTQASARKQSWFPKLKKVTLLDNGDGARFKLLTDIIKHSPNLQQVYDGGCSYAGRHTTDELNYIEYICYHKKVELVKEFQFYFDKVNENAYKKFIGQEPALFCLRARPERTMRQYSQTDDLEHVCDPLILRQMINVSMNSLHTLMINFNHLLYIFASRDVVLPQLRNMSLSSTTEVLPFLGCFDVSRPFPSLKYVKLSTTGFSIFRDPDPTYAYLLNEDENMYQWETVDTLDIFEIQQYLYYEMTYLFPCVRDLRLGISSLDDFEIRQFLWDGWNHVKEITLYSFPELHQVPSGCIGTFLLGIFPAEYKELLAMDEKSLHKYQFAPVFPNIHNSLKLQTICFPRPRLKKFTKVANILGLSRIPDLSIGILHHTYSFHKMNYRWLVPMKTLMANDFDTVMEDPDSFGEGYEYAQDWLD